MPSEIIVALCSLAGTLLGSAAGIVVSNRLVNYRLEQLETKMDKHNGMVERLVIVERDLKSAWRSLDEQKAQIRQSITPKAKEESA